MDPNAALARIRELMNMIDRAATVGEAEDHAVELVDHMSGLDKWISSGGFLPAAWSR